MGEKRLEINLFGACIVRAPDGSFEVTGTKHRAMFALLATAPFGRRTRTFLQDMLWGRSQHDSGRQSLRRALADIKQMMGEEPFDRLLAVNNSEIALDLSQVHFIGRPGGGEFLEGMDIREDEFNEWLIGIRLNPGQLHGLFSSVSQPPPPSILPMIAILPFRPVLATAEAGVLGDWLAEEMCRSLSRSNLLAVISHLSAREATKGNVELGALKAALGVDYCVSGSLRLFGEAAVLDVDFIDVTTGRILWTRQVQGKLADFLSPESVPVSEIVRSVGRTIASEALTHIHGRGISALADHQLLVAGVGLMHEQKLSSFARSRQLIEEALMRAPRSAEAHAWLAEWYVMAVFNGWSTDRARDTRLARESTERALEIEPENAFALTIDGVVHNNLLGRLDTAENRFSGALERNPNESMAWLLSGVLSAYRDDGHDAIYRVEKALKLSPLDPFSYFFDSLAATAYLAAEDWDRALDYADRSLTKNDRHLSTVRARVTALHHLGRAQEAKSSVDVLLRTQPDFTVDGYLRSHPASDFKLIQNVARALKAAGVP